MKAVIEKIGEGTSQKVRLVVTDDAGVTHVLTKAPRRLSGKISEKRAEAILEKWNEAYGAGEPAAASLEEFVEVEPTEE